MTKIDDIERKLTASRRKALEKVYRETFDRELEAKVRLQAAKDAAKLARDAGFVELVRKEVEAHVRRDVTKIVARACKSIELCLDVY